LLARLARVKDAQERMALVVECGRRQAPLAETFKTDEFRVEGCLAHLWLVAEFREGKCFFQTDSDSAIMKGISVMLCEFLQRPDAGGNRGDRSFLSWPGGHHAASDAQPAQRIDAALGKNPRLRAEPARPKVLVGNHHVTAA